MVFTILWTIYTYITTDFVSYNDHWLEEKRDYKIGGEEGDTNMGALLKIIDANIPILQVLEPIHIHTLTHLRPPLRSTFAVRETQSLGQ